MKIGLILPYNITKGGGVLTQVFAQQDELHKRGHEAVIITHQPREPYTANGRRVEFIGSAIDYKTPLNTTSPFSASMLTDEIDSLLEREQFDILHFHEPWVPVLSRQILSRSQVANVATFHAKLPDTFTGQTVAKVFTPYTKPLLRHIDIFTAVSDAAAEYLLSLADVPVEIIPNGVDLQAFKTKPAKKTANAAKTIVYVGRLENRKGVRYLLEAFALLQEREPDVRLVLVGDGPDRDKLDELVRELRLSQVEFLGYVDDAAKLALLQSADLFCSPAIFGESFGVVLLEAMACGLVTVAGDNPGYEAVMQGLGKLSLVNPKDTTLFAHRLQLLLFDEDLRALWTKWAKDYVRQFDYAKLTDRYEAIYAQALALPPKSLHK